MPTACEVRVGRRSESIHGVGRSGGRCTIGNRVLEVVSGWRWTAVSVRRGDVPRRREGEFEDCRLYQAGLTDL